MILKMWLLCRSLSVLSLFLLIIFKFLLIVYSKCPTLVPNDFWCFQNSNLPFSNVTWDQWRYSNKTQRLSLYIQKVSNQSCLIGIYWNICVTSSGDPFWRASLIWVWNIWYACLNTRVILFYGCSFRKSIHNELFPLPVEKRDRKADGE